MSLSRCTGREIMDPRAEKMEDLDSAETPEDVAVLYSWANLHGAKYRDFSASRREYRAQLRHRAAEQVREQALLAQAEAEAAAAAAESAARHAAQAARTHRAEDADSSMRRALREAEEAARTAAAERVEAARRAEAAAVAQAAARREEREIAEAHASAQRQAARYADSELRRSLAGGSSASSPLSGETSDLHTVQPQPPQVELKGESLDQKQPAPLEERRSNNDRLNPDHAEYSSAPILSEQRVPNQQISPRRPQGYRPDDASGVRQIYRGPDYDALYSDYAAAEPTRQHIPVQRNPLAARYQEMSPTPEHPTPTQDPSSITEDAQPPSPGKRYTDAQQQ